MSVQFLKDLFSGPADHDTRVMELMSDGKFRSAAEISLALKMWSGFLYPSLLRLERCLWLDRARDYAGNRPERFVYRKRSAEARK